MQVRDFYFDSSDHKHLAYSKYWIPDTKPIGVIQFIHGMYEHTGRYEEAAQYFTNNGFICCANDLLGHGRTAYTSKGFFGYNHGVKHLLADIEILRDTASSEFEGLPYFLLGFSFGSFLERLLIAEPNIARELSGAIIAGTSGPNDKIPRALEIAKSLVSREGPKSVNERLNDIAFGGFARAFPNEPEPFAWLTSIEGRRQKYANDPQGQFEMTNAALRDLFTIVFRSGDLEEIGSTDTRLPLLFISGKDDPVGNFGKGVRETANLYIDMGMDDVTLKIFPKVRHDVLFDFPATQNKSLPFIKNWLMARI